MMRVPAQVRPLPMAWFVGVRRHSQYVVSIPGRTNAQTSELLTLVTAFFWTFGLAVLFLLAGVGVRFALRKRTWREFLAERAARGPSAGLWLGGIDARP